MISQTATTHTPRSPHTERSTDYQWQNVAPFPDPDIRETFAKRILREWTASQIREWLDKNPAGATDMRERLNKLRGQRHEQSR